MYFSTEVDQSPNTTSVSNISFLAIAVTEISNSTKMDYVTVSCIVIGCVGFLGNAFCCAVIVGHKPLRARLANYYIISQCVLDLFISFLLLTNMTTLGNFIVTIDIHGTLNCYLWKSRILLVGFMVSSTFNILALTIERYFEIVYPIKHKIYFNRRIVIVSIAAVWVIGILVKMALMVPTFTVTPKGLCMIGVFFSTYQSYIIVTVNFLLEYFLDLVIIAFCYIRMGRRLMRSVQPSGNSSSSTVGQESMASRARKNILKTLLSVVVCLALTGAFKQILALINGLGLYAVDWSGNMSKISVIMQFSNCCINPFIYMFQYKEFQKGATALFRSAFKQPNLSVAATESTLTHI